MPSRSPRPRFAVAGAVLVGVLLAGVLSAVGGAEPVVARDCDEARVTAPTTTRLTATTTTTSTTLGSGTTVAPEPVRCVRAGGADRYATAEAIVRSEFEPGVDDLYLATGASFPDGLAGAAAAGASGAPVMLVPPGGAASPELVALVRWLQPPRIVLLGTEDVMSARLAEELASLTGSVARRGGADRYATAVAAASAFAPGVPVVYVATGANWPDGLAAGAVAGAQGGPLLLVERAHVPTATLGELRRLAPARVVIVGGADVVSDAVRDEIAAVVEAPIERVAGRDRYETAAELSQRAYPIGARTVYVATGHNFPDALAGGAAAAAHRGPLLLVKPTLPVPDATAAELRRLQPERLVVLGTDDVVADAVVDELRDLARS